MHEARLLSGSPPSEREQEARERVMASLGMAELSTALVSLGDAVPGSRR